MCIRDRLLAARCALKPMSTIAVRMTLIVSGLVALRKTIAALLAGRKLRCPIFLSRFRMFIETLPKSMSTGHGDRHLWQTVQWSATVSYTHLRAHETPEHLVCR